MKHAALIGHALLAAMPLVSVHAQISDRPTGACLPDAIASLCDRLLPASGHVHITDADGKVRACPCEHLLRGSLDELNALRAVRDRVYLERMDSRWKHASNESWSSGVINTEVIGIEEGDPLVEDTSVYLDATLRCPEERRLRRIVTGIAHLETIGRAVTERFQFTLVVPPALGWDERFMRIAPAGRSGWWIIRIPAPLLWSPHMTDELLVFMLLHEMGHALDDSEPEQVMASELMSDHWATSIGLSAYYGDERAAELRPLIAQAFREYHKDIYTLETFDRSSCETGRLNDYPRLACRLECIRDPQWAASVRGSGFTYPDSCWSTQQCGPVFDPVQEWVRGNCFLADEHTQSPLLGVEDRLASLTDAQRRLDRNLCRARPEICALKPDELGKRLSLEIRFYSHRERRIERVLDRSLRRVRRLNADILREHKP